MRRALLILFLLSGNVFVFSQITLDRAISEAAKELDTRLEPGAVVAVVNFTASTPRMTDYVIGEIPKYLVKSGILKVVERKQVDLIIAEHNFQMSGLVSDETIQGIGHMLGAESVISGSIELVGSVYRFRVEAMNVRTAQVQASYSVNVENDTTTADLMGGTAEKFGLSDYTPTERRGAFALNWIPLASLGSWMMGDYFGGIFCMGMQLVGFGLIAGGGSWLQPVNRADYANVNDYNNAKSNADLTSGGMTMAVVGMGLWLGGYIFNLVRPFHVHKKGAELAGFSPANIGIALVPHDNSADVLLSYRMSF